MPLCGNLENRWRERDRSRRLQATPFFGIRRVYERKLGFLYSDAMSIHVHRNAEAGRSSTLIFIAIHGAM